MSDTSQLGVIVIQMVTDFTDTRRLSLKRDYFHGEQISHRVCNLLCILIANLREEREEIMD